MNLINFSSYIINMDMIDTFIYWSIDIDERHISFFYDGIITKEEYECIKKLDGTTNVSFGEIAKYNYAICEINEINFSTNPKDINMFLNGNKRTSKDLMEYLET